MEEVIDFCELVPMYKLGQTLVLMIHDSELGTENPMCVQVNFGFKKFHKIQGLDYYLKFNPYEPVDWKNKDVRYMYHDMMMRKFNLDDVSTMICQFSQALEDKKSFMK